MWSYLRSRTVRDLLVQALLDAPMFATRWRWNASRSLALLRFRGGKKVPPQLQRMEAEDLLSLCFPAQQACLENIVGDREIPDYPLVKQTVEDCLTEAMDIDALEGVLRLIEASLASETPGEGSITLIARDVTEPSPLASENPERAPVCVPRRRAARGAPDAGRDEPAGGSIRAPRRTSARSTRRPSPPCAKRRGPSRATSRKCTTRSPCSAS